MSKLKISTDTYMLMQSQLLSVMAPITEGFVNASYVKIHIDKLLEENDCYVVNEIEVDLKLSDQQHIQVSDLRFPDLKFHEKGGDEFKKPRIANRRKFVKKT